MEQTREFYCADELATRRCACLLAAQAEPGLVITLDGPLGAGKTHFVKAFGEALGVPASEINSPTYVIVQHYAGRLQLHHLDLYRLKDEDEWYELGADELFESTGVCLVEWANRFPRLLPIDRIAIAIVVEGLHSRKLIVRASGDCSQRILAAWSRTWETCSPAENG